MAQTFAGMGTVIVLSAIGVTGTIVVLAIYQPVRSLDAVLYVLLLALPVGAWIWRKIAPIFSRAPGVSGVLVKSMFTLMLLSPVLGVTLLINGSTDSSEPAPYTAVIVDKDVSASRNVRSYRVYIALPPTRIPSLDRTKGIIATASEYHHAAVGSRKATILIKSGRLGIPWVSNEYLEPIEISGASPTTEDRRHN